MLRQKLSIDPFLTYFPEQRDTPMKALRNKSPLKVIRILLGLIVFLLSACGHVPIDESSEIDFDRVVFLSKWTRSGTVRLTNGQYRKSAAPGSATETVVKLGEEIAYGKLNGRDAAAVILFTNSGGSGTFFDLALLVRVNTEWINTDVAFLGDRVTIHSLTFENEAIIVDMTGHGPDDPMCCPTLRQEQRFTVEDNRLVKTAGRNRDSGDQPLTGIVWKWQQSLPGFEI